MFADVAQWPERLFCKQRVVGSNPSVGSMNNLHAGVAKWPTASDCKSDDLCLRGFESLPQHHVPK